MTLSDAIPSSPIDHEYHAASIAIKQLDAVQSVLEAAAPAVASGDYGAAAELIAGAERVLRRIRAVVALGDDGEWQAATRVFTHAKNRHTAQ